MESLAGVEQISIRSAVLRTRKWSEVAARAHRGKARHNILYTRAE
jgi:hypothetical protein